MVNTSYLEIGKPVPYELPADFPQLVNTPELARQLVAYLKQFNYFAFDVETEGLEGKLTGFSLGLSGGGGWYIPHDHRTLLDQDLLTVPEIVEIFKDFFEDPNNYFIGWNIGYDLRCLWRIGIDITNIECAQVLGWYVDENAPRSLKDRALYEKIVDSATKYSDLAGKGKKRVDLCWKPAEVVAPYAIQDAVLPLQLGDMFAKHLHHNLPELLKSYRDEEIPFIKVLSNMTHVGVRILPDKLMVIHKEYEKKKEAYAEEIYKMAGRRFNIDSPEQLCDVLYKQFRFPVLGRTKPSKSIPTGSPSADKKVLAKLLYLKDNPVVDKYKRIIQLLLDYSDACTVLERYTISLVNAADANNRIHGSFKHVGTVTGRLSSSDPNMQNIPGKDMFREVFVPAEGKVFVIADYSQVELRVLAHFSQDEVMVDAFNRGVDLHSTTAAKVTGRDLDEMLQLLVLNEQMKDKLYKPDPDTLKLILAAVAARKKAKTVNFGIVYGMGKREEEGVTQAFIELWRLAHPGAYAHILAHKKLIAKTGFTETIAGRRRSHPYITLDRKSNDPKVRDMIAKAERAMFSAHIQGSAADIVKRAMVNIYKEIYKFPGANIILQVHDELIVECYPKHAQDIKALMKEKMEGAYILNNVPLVADPSIGYSWADKK